MLVIHRGLPLESGILHLSNVSDTSRVALGVWNITFKTMLVIHRGLPLESGILHLSNVSDTSRVALGV